MTKSECLQRAATYRAEAAAVQATCAILGDYSQYEAAMERAREFERLSALHPKTRDAEIRSWATK